MAALQELVHLLRPGGQALIYVWAMEQEYKNHKSKYLRGSKTCLQDKEEINNIIATEGLLVNQMSDEGSEDLASSVPSTDNIKEKGCKPRKVQNSELPVHTNWTSFHSQDVLFPWHLKRNPGKDKAAESFGFAGCPDPCTVFHHYYHVFCNGELEASCQALGVAFCRATMMRGIGVLFFKRSVLNISGVKKKKCLSVSSKEANYPFN